MAVQHDVVRLDDLAFEVNALAGILACHALETLDERVLAVGHVRIVLDVSVPGGRQ